MRRGRPPLSPSAVQDSMDMGMKVTETTVWCRGRSATFTPKEVNAGKGDAWLAEQEKKAGS